MRKQILTDKENKDFLKKAFGCTTQCVWKALTFKSDSDLAKRIRKLALLRGGKLVNGYVPDCETSYNGNLIEQAFGDRVKLIANRENNNVEVYVDGIHKESRECPTIAELMHLQYEVQQMAAAL